MYGDILASQTVGAGGVASITFNSIPTNYTDLIIVYSGKAGASLVLNNVTTGGLYSRRYLQSVGNSGSSSGGTGANAFDAIWNYYGSETIMTGAVYIPNYSGSTNKCISADTMSEINATNAVQQITGGVFASTSAITSVTITGLGTIPQYSTAYLYGLTKGSGGATVS